MVTKSKFWLNNNLSLAILSNKFVRELYCLDIEQDKPKRPNVVLFHALKDDACKLLRPCDKKQWCLDLIKKLIAIFPKFAIHLVPIDDDYDRYLFHNSPTDTFAGVPLN